MSLVPDVREHLKVIKTGLVDLIAEEELQKQIEKAIQKNQPLRIKYGADPSSPDLHLGHTVPLRKLKQFQELGHLVVFIIGDFTAMIGDPTHRSQTRPMLSVEEVKQNALTYQEQVFKILDRKKTEVRYNSEWLGQMTPQEFLHLTSQYTVARLLERDDFKKRFDAKQPIALIEFLYPLLQGYDSVKVKSDIEIGGTDQKFNLLVGRELQKIWNEKPQMIMTLPIIEGTDGVQKMSKSLQNHIAMMDSPREMFGKVMSIPDSLIARYYQYLCDYEPEKLTPVLKGLESGDLHPREAKANLAERLVTLYHSEENAKLAREEFDRMFKSKGLPDEMPVFKIREKTVDLLTLLKDCGLVESKGEARRMIAQGGVKIDQAKVTDEFLKVQIDKPMVIQCGKRKFARVEYGS